MPWRWGLSFSAYGFRVGLRATDKRDARLLTSLLPLGWKPSSSPEVEAIFSFVRGEERRFHKAYDGKCLMSRSLEKEVTLQALASGMQSLVATLARTRVFVHAGVVEIDGSLVLIPGKSHSGKTSLVAEFLRAGATYYSDEFALLDAQGRVHPYPRPLGVRSEGVSRPTSPAAFRAAVGTSPREADLVLVSEFKEGARFQPRPLSAGLGVLALLQNTVSARVAPARAMAFLTKAAARATILKGTRGEARDAVARIREELQARRTLRGAFDA